MTILCEKKADRMYIENVLSCSLNLLMTVVAEICGSVAEGTASEDCGREYNRTTAVSCNCAEGGANHFGLTGANT